MKLPRPYYEHGFWWWYDPERKDWFVGPAPAFGFPLWWKPEYRLEARKSKVCRN